MKRALRTELLKHFYQHLFVSFIQQKLLHRPSAKCTNKLKSTPVQDMDALHYSQSIKKWRRFKNHNQGHPRIWMNFFSVCELFMSMFQLPRWIKTLSRFFVEGDIFIFGSVNGRLSIAGVWMSEWGLTMLKGDILKESHWLQKKADHNLTVTLTWSVSTCSCCSLPQLGSLAADGSFHYCVWMWKIIGVDR